MVYTDYRPTPLQHFVFPAGGDGLFMVVDERGTFREDNFQKAVAALADTAQEGDEHPHRDDMSMDVAANAVIKFTHAHLSGVTMSLTHTAHARRVFEGQHTNRETP